MLRSGVRSGSMQAQRQRGNAPTSVVRPAGALAASRHAAPRRSRAGSVVKATISPEFSAPEATERAMYDALRQRQAAIGVGAPGGGAPKYKRIMLKVSGEALAGSRGFGLDPAVLESIAAEVQQAHACGIQVAITIGGGNYWRGQQAWDGIERATADYVGMLATVMNAMCMQAALEKLGVPTRVQTAIEMREVAEPYIRRRAIRHLENGYVVVFGAGTGNPYFTTDTAAALRAAEMNAQVFLKATKVDGVYEADPLKHPEARRYEKLSYRRVAHEGLQVMDETAITLCKENAIPVVVYDIARPGNTLRACMGEPVGTIVAGDTDDEAPMLGC